MDSGQVSARYCRNSLLGSAIPKWKRARACQPVGQSLSNLPTAERLRAHQSVGVSNHEESVGGHRKDTDASSESKLTRHACPSPPACREPAARSKLQLTPAGISCWGAFFCNLQAAWQPGFQPKLRLKVGKTLWNLQPSCLGDGRLRAAQPTPALGAECQGGKCKGKQKWV